MHSGTFMSKCLAGTRRGGLELLFGKIKRHDVEISRDRSSAGASSSGGTSSAGDSTHPTRPSVLVGSGKDAVGDIAHGGSPSSGISGGGIGGGAGGGGGGDSGGGSGVVTVREAIRWMCDHLVKERVDLFSVGDGVRPGILVLVNDIDWELEGKLDAELRDGDTLTFISTLHGG